jgi:CheY-like chemotaxis protein
MLSMNSPDNPDARQSSLRVLIVDDSLEDALLVAQELAHTQFQLSWERVENESEYLRQLQTVPDLILVDCNLSLFSAARTLQLLAGRVKQEWPALVLFRIALNADSVRHSVQPLVKTNKSDSNRSGKNRRKTQEWSRATELQASWDRSVLIRVPLLVVSLLAQCLVLLNMTT